MRHYEWDGTRWVYHTETPMTKFERRLTEALFFFTVVMGYAATFTWLYDL